MAGQFRLVMPTMPGFADHISRLGPEDRPVQKFEQFAKFLNEIPWFSEKDDGGQSEEQNASVESAKGMEGYTPDTEAQDEIQQENEKRIASDKASAQMEGYVPDEANVAQPYRDSYADDYDTVKNFDPENALPEEIVEVQKLVGTKPDGIWGPKSEDARTQYLLSGEDKARYGEASQLQDRDFAVALADAKKRRGME